MISQTLFQGSSGKSSQIGTIALSCRRLKERVSAMTLRTRCMCLAEVQRTNCRNKWHRTSCCDQWLRTEGSPCIARWSAPRREKNPSPTRAFQSCRLSPAWAGGAKNPKDRLARRLLPFKLSQTFSLIRGWHQEATWAADHLALGSEGRARSARHVCRCWRQPCSRQ